MISAALAFAGLSLPGVWIGGFTAGELKVNPPPVGAAAVLVDAGAGAPKVNPPPGVVLAAGVAAAPKPKLGAAPPVLDAAAPPNENPFEEIPDDAAAAAPVLVVDGAAAAAGFGLSPPHAAHFANSFWLSTLHTEHFHWSFDAPGATVHFALPHPLLPLGAFVLFSESSSSSLPSSSLPSDWYSQRTYQSEKADMVSSLLPATSLRAAPCSSSL